MLGWSAEEHQIDKRSSEPQREPMYQGKPLSCWVKSIRNRVDRIVLAFDAIIDLGPDAWPAVEELTRIVAEPFTPIRIGADGDDVIAPKLLQHSPSRRRYRCFDCNWRGRGIFDSAADSMGSYCASPSDKSG
jgi:hypothetical protein